MKAPQTPLALRLRTFVTRRRLDRQILAGHELQSSPELALRVRQLTGPRPRRRLAESIRTIIRQAERETAAAPISAVVLQRPAVRHGRAALLDLADQLELAARVNPRGMVLAHEFLCDGFSPLRDSRAQLTVAEASREIQDALAVWPAVVHSSEECPGDPVGPGRVGQPVQQDRGEDGKCRDVEDLWAG